MNFSWIDVSENSFTNMSEEILNVTTDREILDAVEKLLKEMLV